MVWHRWHLRSSIPVAKLFGSCQKICSRTMLQQWWFWRVMRTTGDSWVIRLQRKFCLAMLLQWLVQVPPTCCEYSVSLSRTFKIHYVSARALQVTKNFQPFHCKLLRWLALALRHGLFGICKEFLERDTWMILGSSSKHGAHIQTDIL